jgi:hypothetical protein
MFINHSEEKELVSRQLTTRNFSARDQAVGWKE